MVRSPSRIWWVGALFALTLAGCYEDGEDQIISDRDGALPPDAAGCTVGERRPCDVVDGCGGSQACLGDGTYGPCVAPDEICDGIDNDCDGATDEEFPDIGDTCAAGEGACRDEGTVVCTPDGSDTMCDAQAGDDTDEVCDGVDNDCDGTTDEEVGAGVACETNLPGVCSAGVSACTDGDTVCEPSTEPSDETCDGLDNDCDTNVDEGENGGALAESCYADGEGNAGPEGTEGVGACVAGVRMCSDGMFGACVDAVLPMAEVCDGIDNDCDGTVDNVAEGDCVCEPGTTEDCYDGPDGTDGVGVCQGGVRTCNETGTGYGECVGQRLPGVELCDGADNDCNGEIDDVSGVGEACMEGQGECMAEGQRVCDPETGLVVCDAQPELPGDEICDGLDNDCDGTVDDVEGAGENCEVGVGACLAGGVQVCDLKAGGLVCNAVEGDPVAEICDGVDNDCNGEVDDVDGVGEDCAVGVGACRSTGVTTCDPDGGGVICPATEQDQPSPIDYCDNGIDDDCDGETDEDDCIIPCEVDDDCRGPGETCVDGACVFTACATDDDCAPEQQCVDEVCVDDEICDDDIDNDGDGDTDCADDECAEDPACFQESGCGIGQVVGFGTYQAMVAGESVIATAACASPTDTTGPEAVFIFTADAAGEVCVDTLGSMVDTILTVRGEPCEADGSVIGCNDDAGGDFETGSQVGFSAMAGSTYYFVADTFEGTEGMVTLTVTDGPCAPVPGVEICDNEDDDDDDGLVDCLDEDCAGDPICQDPTLCDEAMPLDLGRTAGMAMGPSRTSAASCTLPVNGADGPEMVYAFGPEDGGTYCIDTRGSMIDTVLTVRGEPCDDPAGEIACNDDFGMGFDASSEVEVELMDGATYYVIVDTFAGGGGDFFVNVREGSCGDDPVEICDDGFDNDGNGDVDCDDIACALDPACPILGDENCGDEVDNDGDGDVDCADADCALSPLCVEDCNNGVDDDADGDVDCDDLDCLLDPICLLGPDEICDNEQDDDDDGLTDCADADCVDDPFCQQDYACEDAIPVVFGSVEGTLDGESRTSLASCSFPPNDAAGPEAVYVFTPAADGEFCVDTDTVGLFAVDTILTVRVDPCNDPGSEVGCNDDADFILGSDSEVTVAGTAGTPYYIVVDSYEGDSGDFTLNVAPGNCDDPQPFEICDNDQDDDGDGDVDCDDADCALDPICLAPVEICDNNVDDDGDDAIDCADPDCVGDDNCPAVGACETPLIIDGPGVYIGDTTGQPSNQTETAEDCVTVAPGQALSPESVLMWMPEEAGDYCLLTTGSAFDTVLYVRADVCDDPAAEIACNDDNGVAGGTRSALDLSVEAGRAYYVFVDGFGQDPPRQGPYTLTVRPGPCVPPVEICDNGEDDDGDGDVDCADADCDGDPICVEICDDEIDNDLDGDTDCADADCADDPACLALDCDYDFEGGELDPVFETDGDAPWTIDGGVATSGDIGDNQQSNLRVSVSTPAGGTVSFRYRVSGEEPDGPDFNDFYDYLQFSVDGVRVGAWAGDVPFTDFEVELDPGDHVLEWSYIKDGSVSQREDRAQIDDLSITGAVGLCSPAEGDLRLVEGEDAQSGRLEVFHDGVWGTVCDDLWETGLPSTTSAQGFVNGDVACRQLGFVGAAGTYDAPPGVDPTWLDQVACVGDEGRLIDCPANDFGDEDCGHGEDIGLRCLTAGNCRIDAHCLDGQICVEGVCADGAREICDNGADDDGDGDTDCADADCADDPVCGPFTCENARPIGFETQTVFLRGDGNYEMASCTFPPNGADGPDAAFAFSHDELDAITICVDTLGSTVDTVLTAYFELCEANAEFACDDDSGVAGTSQIQLTVEPFINVPLIVDTFAGESGEATITVTRGPCEPIGPPEVCDDDVDNDDDGLIDCADAECAGDPSCNDPLACEGAPEIGFGTERGTLEGESAISEASCALPIDGASGPEAIYAFVPDAPGTVCVDTFGSAVDTILTVRADGCVGAGSELSCSDDADGFASEAEFDALAGSTYYIVVDSYGGDSGDFAVRVRPGSCDLPIPDELCIGGLDEDLDGLVDCDDPDCAGSVGCADPADLCSYDFEGGDFDPAFETDGDAPWTIEGGVATSGDIDDSQSSTLRLAVSTPTGGAVAFSYRVSSEAPGAFGTLYDYLEFRVDGVPVLQEAGEVDFTDFEVALLPGDHTLEWIYRKDGSVTAGEDLAQIDDVVVSGAEGLCEGAPVEICNNGGDDDGDGDADCLDADCFADPACLPDLEVDCDDGIDNDGDGDTDCLDADCAADLACLPEVDCNDGIDNDGDGDTDCDDADCAADPICDVPASDGAVFFLVNNGEFTASELHVRDGDGDATFVGPITLDGQPASVEAIALTPDGTLYGFLVEKGTLVLEIDPVTAEGTLVNNNDGEPVIIDDIVFGAGAAPDGTVYLLMGFNQTIAPFDGLTVGAAVAGLPSFFQFGDIAFDPNGTCYLAGVDIAGEPTGLYTCDLDAGTFELLGDASQGFDDPAAAVGLAVGPGGDLCLGALYGSEVRGSDEYGVYDLTADPPLLTRAGAVGIDFAPPDFGDAAGWYTPPDDPACEIVVEICDNDIDDDGNGDTDCDDAACALDPACPPVAEICDNDIDDDRDGDTDCDDPDCAGDPACPAPLDGDLIITEVMPNPFGSDTGTEWFELYNGTGAAIDLSGWTLRDDDFDSEVIMGPLVIESGEYLAFADGANPGFTVDYVFSQTLANSGDEIVLVDLDGAERAAVRYDNVAWPWGNGFAAQFDARLDADTAAAADPANWCQAVQQYRVNAPGDFGTPGEPNDPCGPVEPEPMPISAPAESFAIDGSIDDGDGLWMLPTEDCADRGNGQVYAYDTYRVVNETGAPQRITVTGDWPDDYSGPAIIHAYTEPFDAADPLTGCITGSRNGTNGLVDYLPVVEIDPGEVLTLVISATTPVPDGGMMPIGNPPQPYFGAYTLTVTTVSLDPDPVDYCQIQFPATIEGAPGDEVTVYGRVYEQGLTDRTASGFDYDPYLSAQLGYIADGDDPSDPANWTWIDAEGNAGFNAPGDDPNIDEYQAVLTVPAPGDYWYAYRFSVDAEVSWQLCDVNGAGANPDAGDFLIDDAGLMLSEAAGPSACEQGCADAFACGFGAALGGSDEADCVARCEAGEITEEQAQCVADALDPAAGPVGCNALALLACQ